MEPLEPCKYFLNVSITCLDPAKAVLTTRQGNCKYGRKCALPHIVNGDVVNYPPPGQNVNRVPVAGAGYMAAPGTSPSQQPSAQYGSFGLRQDFHTDRHALLERGLRGPHMGSSSGDARLGVSPPVPGASALDATLPSSFNSQDASNIAKYGPSGASVPARLSWDPLTVGMPTTATTRQQAFGNLDSMAMAAPAENHKDLASSPPQSHIVPEPQRLLRPEMRSKPQSIVSASVPAHAQYNEAFTPAHAQFNETFTPAAVGDEGDDTHGEDLLPSSLNDLLTPQEKTRRYSKSGDDHGLISRQSLSSFGSPTESKVGSPSHASPSRFGAFFAGQAAARKEAGDHGAHSNVSGLGHVGSPLRNSTMSSRVPGGNSSPSFGPISPPNVTKSQHVSSLSQQLRSVQLGPSAKSGSAGREQDANTSSTRHVSNQSTASAGSAISGQSRQDRAVSGTSAGRSRIDEEPCVFSMEDDEENKKLSAEIPREM